MIDVSNNVENQYLILKCINTMQKKVQEIKDVYV